MFRKKYIFETRSTRVQRYLNILGLGFFLGLLAYVTFCFILIVFANEQSERSRAALFKRPPDLIVVFTGDAGRISFGLKKSQEYNQRKIFITGVYSKNSLRSVIRRQVDPAILQHFDLSLVDIDYLAHNTVGNVLSTLRYVREKSEIKSVLVISHDYHILRIKVILDALNAQRETKFYFTSLKTKFDNYRNIKILVKEVYKLIRAYVFVQLWEDETVPEP